MRNADFDFINDLFGKIVDEEKENGRPSLTADELLVTSIWHASGIIGNGGLQYFFEQELDAEAVACAYDKINLGKCAELLRLGLSLIPEALMRGDWQERIEFVENNPELFKNLDNAFWDADEGMQDLLVKYVKAHADNIPSLLKKPK
jgi:Domain of unknown function (DUF4375)